MDWDGEGRGTRRDELDGAGWQTVVQQLFDHSPIAMCLVDLDGRFLDVNPALCRFLGRSASDLRRLRVGELTHPEDRAEDEEALADLLAGRRDAYRVQKRFSRPDGELAWGDLSVSVVRDEYESPRRLIAQLVDVTADRAVRAELALRSASDPLTGLANRDRTLEVLGQALRHRGARGTVGVLYVDLDGFKSVNDAMGHAAGDRLLTVLADRMVQVVGPAGTVGRMGGDEFVVVLDGARSVDEVEAQADALRRALAGEVAIEGALHRPTVSIGVAVADPTVHDAEELVRAADTAMYRAKRAGRNRWERYDAATTSAADEGAQLVAALGPGAMDGEIDAWFQPVVELETGAVVGHEALARWRHPRRGVLRPAQFLPTAEDRGLAALVDEAVLARACAWLSGGGGGFVSVNLSLGFLLQSEVAERVRRALDEQSLDPSCLVLEITEAVSLQLPRAARRDLEALDAVGVRVFVDDFGTGYGALAVFDDLPVRGVKLDRSLASSANRTARSEQLLVGLRHLVDALGVFGVVEGVETVEELDRLRAMGWRHGQGYLLGGPRPEGRTTPAV
jgi:diguanylate cyclase (GGDEF)-like protein/PAS domain S-box-containing protein